MPKQNTRINKIQKSILDSISISFSGPWKTRSIGLLSLLLGYYLSSNFVSYLINTESKRILILLSVLFLVELSIRINNNFLRNNYKIFIMVINNLRIGTTYAIILEAFKLGS